MEGCDDIEADAVLFATGRNPNVEGLGWKRLASRLASAARSRSTSNSRTSVPSIFAVGDVTDRIQLTPVAIREGHAFADSQFGNKPWTVDYDCVPHAVFSHPPIAGVGHDRGRGAQQAGPGRTYTSDFRPMKNVLAGRNERSLYKLVVDGATDQVVGIHMIGPDAPKSSRRRRSR